MRRFLVGSLIAIGVFSADAWAKDAPPDPEEARRARVFARVGEKTITVGELEDTINERSPYSRKRFEDPEVLKQFADDQVKAEIFAQGAERHGYRDDSDVRAFLDQTIVQLFIRKEFEEAAPPESITDEQVEEYYNEHPDEFRRPEMRRASHILVASRQEAKELIKEVEAGSNESFRMLAKQRSLDTETKVRGGDLLYFTRDGRMVGAKEDTAVDPALVKAAFTLRKTGDVTRKPIDLGDGKWSVLRLTAVRPARVQSLRDAGPGIRRRLWREGRKAALDKLILELRVELEPEVHPERMDAIVLPPRTAPINPPNQ